MTGAPAELEATVSNIELSLWAAEHTELMGEVRDALKKHGSSLKSLEEAIELRLDVIEALLRDLLAGTHQTVRLLRADTRDRLLLRTELHVQGERLRKVEVGRHPSRGTKRGPKKGSPR